MARRVSQALPRRDVRAIGRRSKPPLFALARRALADPANSGVPCPMLGPIPGTRETVTVSLKDKTLVLKGEAGTLDLRCGGSIDTLAKLFKAADATMLIGRIRPRQLARTNRGQCLRRLRSRVAQASGDRPR